MGYMLPIPNYLYRDYHSRITKSKTDPFPIGKLSRSRLDVTYTYQKYKSSQDTKHQCLYVPQKQNQEAIDKIYADIAGIGRIINERV